MSGSASTVGVSEFTTWPWSFERDLDGYVACGADAIEITEFKLDTERIAEQLAGVAGCGLTISSVQATLHGIFPTKLQPEPLSPADRIRHIRASIERIAPHVPPQTPFVTITGAPPDGDIARAVAAVEEALGDLAAFAQSCGVRIALEPLNPSLMNVDSAVCALDDALAIVDRVDHPALGLCVDAWNVWQSRDLEATIARAGHRIFLVQLSDWRTPRGYYDRIVPGTGVIALGTLLRAVRGAGYGGPYVIEIFSSESLPDSLWRSDLDRVVRTSVANVRELLESVPTAAGGPT